MRLQINTTQEVVDKIDKMAKERGISRNAMCAILLHAVTQSETSVNYVFEPPDSNETKDG